MKKPRELKERDIKKYLVQRVKTLGGELRKVAWEGRANAPDWVVMMPRSYDELRNGSLSTTWIELKNPETIKTFPANAHERAQHREHERMRKMGQRVEVIGTFEQVDALLS